MRSFATLAASLVWLCAPVCAEATTPSTANKTSTSNKNRRRPKSASPKISAKDREKATAQVAEWLARVAPIENAQALAAFFARLSEAAASPVRALQFGDSHTAADSFSGAVRAALQQQYGDGGIGFGFAGRPFIGYRRLGSPTTASKGWKAEGLTRGLGDGLFGLGGVSLTATVRGASLSLRTTCSHFEIQFLRQPHAGRVEVSVDGMPQTTIDTAGQLGPGSSGFDVADGQHLFEIRTLDRLPVRLWGWVTDRNAGVTYENLGINGAQASLMLLWDEPSHIVQLAKRDPSLVVMAYGTNEAGMPDWDAGAYYQALSGVVNRIRKAVPAASLLIIGPPDREVRKKKTWTSLAQLDGVIAIQQRIAREQNAAFWDQRTQMGGAGSIHTWYLAGLAQPDHVHLTEAGYTQLGQHFSRQLVEQRSAEAVAAAGRNQGVSHNGQKSANTRDSSQSHQN